MSETQSNSFVFVTCQRGAENALKREVAKSAPDFRLAFSRPGFVTFKTNMASGQIDQLAARWVFARTYGTSLGKLQGERMHDLARQLWQEPSVQALVDGLPIRDLHVWQVDASLPGDHGFEPGLTLLAREITQAVRQAAPEEFRQIVGGRRHTTALNANVLDVAIVEPGSWWFGTHRAASTLQRYAGGVIPIRVPPEAPSRAYRKMEEALRWSGIPLRAGEECVELGCAPGGASWALLERGMFVTGIDPAEVDPTVNEHPRFRHIQRRSADVPKREFRDVRWLVADINVAPQYTLDAVEAIVTRGESNVRGMVVTLKLLNWNLAEQLDQYAERTRGWGFRDVRMRQLASNRQEVCVVALRARTLRRLTRGAVDRADQRTSTAGGDSKRRQRRIDGEHPSTPRPHF